MGDTPLSFTQMKRDSVKGAAVSMRRRLLMFLLILAITMLTGAMLLLATLGAFPFGAEETGRLMTGELVHLTYDTENQLGGAYRQAVRLSERLSVSISDFMRRANLPPTEIQNRPDLLEPLLRELTALLQSNLEATECSGVFLALDATVNPDLPGAAYSKAGLYIRAIEPTIGNMGTGTRYLLRGPAALAGDGRLNLQAQWDLEFDISGQPYWQYPVRALEADRSLPLSRLAYWCAASPVEQLNEDVMICSLPVLDEANNLLGICGFEISQMNFMLRHEPAVSGFYSTVYLFSSRSDGEIALTGALYSGNIARYGLFPETGLIRRTDGAGRFPVYVIEDAHAYIGMEKEIRLYPAGSPYAGQVYAAALLVAKEEYDAIQYRDRMRFVVTMLVLTALGLTASIILSQRYMQPITDMLAQSGGTGAHGRTNITEIDQLIEKLMGQRRPDGTSPESLFAEFIARLDKLTPTEKEIFRRYADGRTANAIKAEMHISASTVKTHSGHIYAKLGISSREELLLYAELIKKSGLEEKMYADGRS